MPFDHEDPIQHLQLRVGALEYLIRQLAAAQSDTVLEMIKNNTDKQIDLWKEKSPEIVEIMQNALEFLPRK